MRSPLAGKVALVTGASRGIGAAIARRLAHDGAHVLVHYGRGADKARQVAGEIQRSGGSALTVSCDLARHTSIAAMFEDMDRRLPDIAGDNGIDILVNNAAAPGEARLEALTPAEVDRIVDTNVKGTFYVTQAAVARMRDEGRIISIGSLSSLRSNPDHLLYTATKGALNSMTLALAQHLGPRGITVNAILPGLVETDMSLPGDAVRERVTALTALGRIGQPADIADMVAALASPDGRWITGQWIAVSGGQRL